MLDADDIWLPEKTRVQVQMLQERPSLGLVFSDMAIIDAEERVTAPSLIGQLGTLPRRAYARVFAQNVATQSSIMIRASLRELYAPIPAEIPYSDWWLTLRAAQVAEIDYSRAPLALYRQHGANLTGGVTGAGAVREHRKEIRFQLWCLRHLPLATLTPEEMVTVWAGVEEHGRRLLAAAGSYFATLTDIDADPARAELAQAEAERLGASGDLAGAAEQALRALGWDPYLAGGRERLLALARRAAAAGARPHPLAGARSFVVLADAEELLSCAELMDAYAEALSGSELITLAIDSTRLPAEVAERELRRAGEPLRADRAQRHRSARRDRALRRGAAPPHAERRARVLHGHGERARASGVHAGLAGRAAPIRPDGPAARAGGGPERARRLSAVTPRGSAARSTPRGAARSCGGGTPPTSRSARRAPIGGPWPGTRAARLARPRAGGRRG